jgi:hypothetical protein
MEGTIFRLPDDTQLQRGITFTIMPDGRSLRVPAMSRIHVRAASQSHDEGGGQDMMQALKDILKGKKPGSGREMNRRPGRERLPGGGREGLRQARVRETLNHARVQGSVQNNAAQM